MEDKPQSMSLAGTALIESATSTAGGLAAAAPAPEAAAATPAPAPADGSPAQVDAAANLTDDTSSAPNQQEHMLPAGSQELDSPAIACHSLVASTDTLRIRGA
jgi:hypothetical protein